MADIKWTPSQKAAIDTRGRNILVSAAAGSGKTAVLVERIINRVMRDRDSTDIDRMLIVTFTNAAAAEMKEKINKRLRSFKRTFTLSRRNIGPFRAAAGHLYNIAEKTAKRKYEQLAALDDADICTIDSFCKKCVQSFAHELDIAPDFRLYDPAEDSMVIDEAADKLIDECYEKEDEHFERLSESLGDMRGDRAIKEIITKIYGFLQSYAEPLEKLDEIFSLYNDIPKEDLFSTIWARELMEAEKEKAQELFCTLWISDNGNVNAIKGSTKYGVVEVSAKIIADIAGAVPDFDEQADNELLILADFVLSGRTEDSKKLAGELFEHLIDTGAREKLFEFIDNISAAEADKKIFTICELYRNELIHSCGAVAAEFLAGIENLYISTLAKIKECKCENEDDWNYLFRLTKTLKSAKLSKPRKSKAVENSYSDHILTKLAEFKNMLSSYKFNYILQSADEVSKQYGSIVERAEDIKVMTARLSAIVENIKLDRNMFSFADVEHMAYRLVTDSQYADIAQIYKERYTDIMIDEYQDTNGLQDAIFAGISNGRNIFMVGDLKQSIYAFRGGDPSIFKKKGAEYTPIDKADMNGTEPVRIDLADNFRSNSSVVDAVNELFEYVMTDKLGDVDYNKKGEKLVCGRNLGDSEEQKNTYADEKSEVVVLPYLKGADDDGDTDKLNIEARYVAERIRKMVDGKMEIAADGTIRHVKYSDFTIIAGSVKSIINAYNDALNEHGIPLAIPSIGYYDFFEVNVVLSFLRVIANRRRDVPIVTLMRSPIGGFSDEELAKISASAMDGDFYERLCRIVSEYEGGNTEILERAVVVKINRFIELIDRFDSYKHYKTVAAIVYSIYTETGFYDFVGAMDGGKLAQKNLNLLYEKAKKFEAKGAGSLYSFVKYIEKLKQENNDEQGASIASESQDAVKLMTIHASKGLEFPIVFMVSCGKDFPPKESRDGIIDREAGIGLAYLDSENRIKIKSPIYNWVSLKQLREHRSEDVRKLYVGATRAREKLICTIIVNQSEDEYDRRIREMQSKGAELFRDAGAAAGSLISAKGFYGWILPAYFAGTIREGGSKWKYESDANLSGYVAKDVAGIINYKYRFNALTSLPSKTTVSKIKEEHNKQEGIEAAKRSAFASRYTMSLDKLPELAEELEFSENKPIPANVMGTAYHKAMELSNPEMCGNIEEIKHQLDGFAENGEINIEILKNIKPEYIFNFYNNGEIGAKIKEAYKMGRLYRETPFEIAISPDEYSDDISGGYFEEDKILLQGTIDCWFEDECGDVYIVDYKTDAYRGASDEKSIQNFADMKAEEYSIQLELYARALKLGIDDGTRIRTDIKGKYIYLFSIDQFVEIL